jgi:IS605 OrfB family transposase
MNKQDTVIRRQGYKFRLEPKPKHLDHLNRSLGANRFVWNKLLSMNLHRLRNGLPLLWYEEMTWWITLWKTSDEYAFLRDAPSQSLQQTAKALERAFKDAFDKSQPHKRLPTLKKLGKNEAGVKYPQGFMLDENNRVIRLPKLGWVKYRNSRPIEGEIKNVTVSRRNGRYWLSIQTQRTIEKPVHPSTTMIGVDLGVKRLLTCSDGNHEAPIQYPQLSKKLIIAQRKLSRMVNFSANWHKQKKRINRLHTQIGYVRQDRLNKVSTELSKNHALIVLEDLKTSNMTRSAKGTQDNPGSRVKQKSGLNRAILSQGWRIFRDQLTYKQQWRGGDVIRVAPHHTSQTCPCCRHVSKDNRQTQAEFRCVECGYENHADLVGALNILARGQACLAGTKTTAGHMGIACQVNGAVMPSAAGTIPSPSGETGIPGL